VLEFDEVAWQGEAQLDLIEAIFEDNNALTFDIISLQKLSDSVYSYRI